MQTKDVEVNGKKFKITEMLASAVDEIDFTDSKKAIKAQVILSTGMTESDYAMLTFKERITLQKEINLLNGIGMDFQKPTAI